MFQGFHFPLFFSASNHFSLSRLLFLSLTLIENNEAQQTQHRDQSMWRCGGFDICVCVLEWISGWVLGCVFVSVWVSAFVFVFRHDLGLSFGFCLRFRFVFRAWVSVSLCVSGWLFSICWFRSGLLIFLFFFYLVFCSFLLKFSICLFL